MSKRKPTDLPGAVLTGHNGGPPLDEVHTPEWGNDGIGNYFYWKAAHRAAWRNPSPGIAAFRARKAERLGLTYHEYTLEILERGRHLQIEAVERIAQTKRKRRYALESNPDSASATRSEPILMRDIQMKAVRPAADICAGLSEMLI